MNLERDFMEAILQPETIHLVSPTKAWSWFACYYNYLGCPSPFMFPHWVLLFLQLTCSVNHFPN